MSTTLLVRQVTVSAKAVQNVVTTKLAVIATGPQGAPAPGGSNFYHEHDQVSAATSWPIAHNLGSRPNVQVLDTSGRAILAEIQHVDANNLTITLNTATAGKAILS